MPRTTSPRSRVCGLSLFASDQGILRTLLTVADTERTRPRKMVTARMARFDRFLQFSASPQCQWNATFGQWPKTAEIDQAPEGQSCGQPPRATQSDSVITQWNSGEETAGEPRSKPPSTLRRPKPLCFKIRTVKCDRERKIVKLL